MAKNTNAKNAKSLTPHFYHMSHKSNGVIRQTDNKVQSSAEQPAKQFI